MTPFSRSKAAGQTTGASFSAREPTAVGEREDQLLGRSDPPPSPVPRGLSEEYAVEAIVRSPATPIWPPPGALTDPPRGTSTTRCVGCFASKFQVLIRCLPVTEFTISASSASLPPASPVSAASYTNAFDFCGPPPNLHLEVLPQEVVSRICAISVTNDSKTRPTLQATSKFLFNTLCTTPDAWDTFEVMTRTPGCLTTPSQVEQHIQRSGARPLSVALTVARPQDHNEPENVQAIIKSVVDAASRIEDLILDVHCDASEHALIRLFSPSNPPRQSTLRRLALVGKLQLDYILSSLTQPVFSSLRHLTIAYGAIYSLDTTIDTVESLKLGVTFLAPHPSGGSIIGLLRAFPSLRKLELQTLTYAPGYNPRVCGRDSNGNDAVLQLGDLEVLVLDSIPLDCEVFASLRCPHVRKLVLKDILPELPECTSGWDMTQRFDEFVARQDWAHLEDLEVGGVYEGVQNTCIELIKIAEGRLKELTLGGFTWDACKALMTPGILVTPDTAEPSTFPIEAVIDIPKLFPALERLVIRLDDTEDHHQLTRQAWMDGLQQFTLGRIAYDTVADVLFRGYQNAPRWLQALGEKMPSWRLAHEDGLKDHLDHFTHCPSTKVEGSTRTLTHISLETSFNDSYAFIWNEYEHLKDIYGTSV